jgi:hypothetical protein
MAEFGYPPVVQDEVFKEIFLQAENFKKYQWSEKIGDYVSKVIAKTIEIYLPTGDPNKVRTRNQQNLD